MLLIARLCKVLHPSNNPTLSTGALHPKHVVQATVLNGEQHIPDFPGMDSFDGKYHIVTPVNSKVSLKACREESHRGRSGKLSTRYRLGCFRRGRNVTMIQRFATFVMSLASTRKIIDPRFDEGKVSGLLLQAHSIDSVFNCHRHLTTRIC